MFGDRLRLAWKQESAAVGAQIAVRSLTPGRTARCTCTHRTNAHVFCGSLKMDGVKSEQLLRVDRTSAWLARRMLRTPSRCALCIVIGSRTIVSISCAYNLLLTLLFEDTTTARHEHIVLKLVLLVGLVRLVDGHRLGVVGAETREHDQSRHADHVQTRFFQPRFHCYAPRIARRSPPGDRSRTRKNISARPSKAERWSVKTRTRSDKSAFVRYCRSTRLTESGQSASRLPRGSDSASAFQE
jgi:hypothetical protein